MIFVHPISEKDQKGFTYPYSKELQGINDSF